MPSPLPRSTVTVVDPQVGYGQVEVWPPPVKLPARIAVGKLGHWDHRSGSAA